MRVNKSVTVQHYERSERRRQKQVEKSYKFLFEFLGCAKLLKSYRIKIITHCDGCVVYVVLSPAENREGLYSGEVFDTTWGRCGCVFASGRETRETGDCTPPESPESCPSVAWRSATHDPSSRRRTSARTSTMNSDRIDSVWWYAHGFTSSSNVKLCICLTRSTYLTNFEPAQTT